MREANAGLLFDPIALSFQALPAKPGSFVCVSLSPVLSSRPKRGDLAPSGAILPVLLIKTCIMASHSTTVLRPCYQRLFAPQL